MFEAIKEYKEIQKMSWGWCKKHWKGYLGFVAAAYGITIGALHLYLKKQEENEEES